MVNYVCAKIVPDSIKLLLINDPNSKIHGEHPLICHMLCTQIHTFSQSMQSPCESVYSTYVNFILRLSGNHHKHFCPHISQQNSNITSLPWVWDVHLLYLHIVEVRLVQFCSTYLLEWVIYKCECVCVVGGVRGDWY